jgi:hypothetical protein
VVVVTVGVVVVAAVVVVVLTETEMTFIGVGALLTPDNAAVIFALPTATAVTRPADETVAMPGVSLAQVT